MLVAERLHDLDALRSGLTVKQACDVLWFYFGSWSWFTLQTENKWSWDDTEKWLLSVASNALLKPTRRRRTKP
jgi:hypothetical protein